MPPVTRRGVLRAAGIGVATSGLAGVASAGPGNGNGRDGFRSDVADEDGNGIADEGEVVTGRYRALYAYDANGDFYTYNLTNRRLEGGTVDSLDDLDPATRTVCHDTVQYRGTLENDPFQDTGWIKNAIRCEGADRGSYSYLFVHETDTRYTGDGPATWGDWEYHVLMVSGAGNVLITDTRPANGS